MRKAPFTLAAEASRIVAIVDALGCPMDLVRHAYGGGVAVEVARARPHMTASLSLYEPACFPLLRHLGERAAAELGEIEAVCRQDPFGLDHGRVSAAAFIDYWNGVGAWLARMSAWLLGRIWI